MIQKEGRFQFEKDKEAAKSYFVDHVNQNTVFFHDLKEKLDYLVENDYYEKEFLDKYTFEQIKEVFNITYSKKFRFSSYMSAFKFYNDYALKTNDKSKILERYEDRLSIMALYLADGDFNKAKDFIHIFIGQEYQPATPTTLNAGKKRRGELVSCFLLECNDSLNDISKTVDIAMQLSKIGGGVSINLSKIRAKGEAIKDIENATKGVVGVMKLFDHAFRYADQMGQRQGSGAVYLNVFHRDIIDFLDTKKINADEDFRVKTLSIGVVIPDKMIELAREDKDMYTFYPHTVYKEYGLHLDEMDMSIMYDALINNDKVRKVKINPRKLLEQIAVTRFESGYPYIMFQDNVNKVHALDEKVKFSNLCVTGDTKLLTEDGYVEARELYKEGHELIVVIDNRTINYDKNQKGVTSIDAIPMQLTAKNAEVFKLETKEGFELKATKWHKMYVQREGEIIKIPLKDVKEGDKILVQSGAGSFGKIHYPELAYVAGLIAGDGCLTENQAIIYLYGEKGSLSKIVEDKVKYIIDKSLDRSIEYKHNADYAPTFNVNLEQNRKTLHSGLLLKIMKEYGIRSETKTKIPDFVFYGDKETQAAYLSGIYQMDGTVNCNAKYKAGTIELVQTNEKFLQEIQMMLLNMGIYSTIYSAHKEGNRIMPDGNGGTKEYYCKQTYKISVQDRTSRELFNEIIDLKPNDKQKLVDFTATLQPVSRQPKHNYQATVTSIDFYGIEDVYDTTQEDYHSLIFNGIVTGNCSEILQKSEVSTYADYGHEDFIGQDISCNLGSINIANVMDNKSIEKAVKLAIDALTFVSDSTDIKNAPAVRKANELMHSVGLGAMNLHGFLAKNRIQYQSEIARDFANTFFMMVNYYSLVRSMEIAKERGETFNGFDKSKYATGEYFEQYLETDFSPTTDKVEQLFDGIYIPTINDWNWLKEQVMKHGLYHAYRLAIAPTGSISYVQSSTAGVMPITERIEERTYGNSKTYYPMPFLNESNWFYYTEAYDMNMFDVVDMISSIQKHVDQGISFTLFLKDTMTTRDLTKIDLYAHHKGIKTIYYARTKRTKQDECLSCTV
ncbi:ribonucleotide reductase N-terminal alpha domain-containing protein [Paenibacillus sp. NAIST15-1]|uniref:ribonucleotide reductase N-terminal alpha domain-containing protein n=1 Tax=Paenibacillus sp. NAIST15-1 TaxID=1605994 RepID=UPI000933911E